MKLKLDLEQYITKYGIGKVSAAVISLIVITLLLSFGITSFIVYGVCWAFGYAFSFKLAFGVWLIFIAFKALVLK